MSNAPRTLRSANAVRGSLRLPGDKSISHRYAMLAALAEGTSKFTNYSDGADCATTLACVSALGAKVERNENGVLGISGCSGKFSQPAAPLDCGNSGSTMRMLAGVLAGQNIECELFGDASLSRRPMRRIVTPLAQMGSTIAANPDGLPPLRIAPPKDGKLRGAEYISPVASAQVKSAVLFAGLQAEGETAFQEPAVSRDHSELALRAFGAKLRRESNRITIKGPQKLHAIEAAIPGDISSAAFFLCAAALLPGSSVIFDGLGLNPTRAALLDVLAGMGARINVLNVEESHGELSGSVKVEHGALRGAGIGGAQIAQLLDELPVLAAIAPFTDNGISIRDARELRVKESDRIAAVAVNLRLMGAQVEEHEDGLTVPGLKDQQKLHAAVFDAQGDHRIAMAFAIAALRLPGGSKMLGAEHVGISFPRFWEMLEIVAGSQ